MRGQVVNSATTMPLHRVKLTLNGDAANAPVAVTDTRGEFEFIDVPPGTYTISAVRAGYLPTQYGQRRLREAGRPIDVQAGGVVEGVQIAMYRGGVLAGRVSDEQGDPAPGARVEAVEFRYINGRRIPVAAAIATSNDIGEFRLGGLPPGAYQLRASTGEAWESDDGKTTFVHAVTYFPGVTGVSQAQTLNVGLAQQITDLDVRLVAGQAARIDGVVEDGDGRPMPSQQVHLSNILRTIGGALLGSGSAGTTRTDARGTYEFRALAPGEYLVHAGGPSERATASALLNAGETKRVVLSPRKPTTLGGEVVAEDGAPLPFAANRLRVWPLRTDADHPLLSWGAPSETTVSADRKFRMTDIQGEYLFRVRNLPREWMVKSVTLGGRDITDSPLAVAPASADIQGLQIVLANRGGSLSGVVEDRNGTPLPDVTVLVFAESRGMWGPGSRFVHTARPDAVGRFVVHGLPTAVYRVVAKEMVIDGQWEDPEYLQSL
ncbi:MAG: carboxypeptidase-like regulatory domain-containing protein, partial [Acidobacteriota bacterium]|nr:carboxypeptidase-like regulatory domain-containing protein [Acidobacteriota bacterium]